MTSLCFGIVLLLIILLGSNVFAIKRFTPPLLFVFASSVLFMAYGALMFSKEKPGNNKHHFVNQYERGSLVRLKIQEELRHSDYYLKYKARVTAVGQRQTTGSVILRFNKKENDQKIHLNHDILTREEISAFKKPLNPGAFDFKEAMSKKHLYHQITLSGNQFITEKNRTKNLIIEALLFREMLLESLKNKGFDEKEFSVIEALLLGRKQDLSFELMKSYQKAGAMHLLAISGLHIGIMLIILNFILKPIERFNHGKKIKLILIIITLWMFAFLSGLSVSVIRAVFMFTILSIGMHANRNSTLSHYLFTALFFSLVIKPELLFDLGFQLSYTAVIGIICIAPLMLKAWKPNNRVVQFIWNLVTISLAAQLGVLPLSLYYFHQFSGLFIFSSICIIPILGFILGAGYLMIILNLFNMLPEYYVKVYCVLIQLMNAIIEYLGNLNQLVFERIFFTLTLLILSYMLIISLISWLRTYAAKYLIWMFLSVNCLFLDLLVEKSMVQQSAEFVIFNDYKKTLIIRRKGMKVKAIAPPSDKGKLNENLITDYELVNYDLEIEKSIEMKHFFKEINKRIMIIDHHHVTDDFGFNPDILVLINSPRINLERLLNKINPETIVADGSNYLTFKSLWKMTAEKRCIKFHDTTEEGAFTIKSSI